MNDNILHKIYFISIFGALIFMNILYQSRVLTSIKALSLQCGSTYNITIPDDDGVEWTQ